jgi:DNA-binding transcriptional ArsR family regulator
MFGAVQADVWGVLLEPHRRALLGLLRQRPQTVGELVVGVGLAQPATSKHLRVLRDAGLVRVTTDGPRRIYALDPAPLTELDEWLAPYRALWNRRLDSLGDHLDRTREEP